MIGPSYLGLVQWAVAPDAGDDLAALAIQVSASQFHGQTYAGGSLSLETVASWLVLVAAQERRFAPLAMPAALRRLPALLAQLPLGELDERATGSEVAWFREGSRARGARTPTGSPGTSPRASPGRPRRCSSWVAGTTSSCPGCSRTSPRCARPGATPQLMIGPWTHTAPGLIGAGIARGAGWLRAQLLGDRPDGRPPRWCACSSPASARGGGWRELPSWPPPETGERRLWLAARRDASGRAGRRGDARARDRYRYDPADPTPSLGGPVLLAREPVVDNRALEARADVLTYTTPPLPARCEAIGPVRVELCVRASAPHFDMFARVCDVDLDAPRGTSATRS